MSLPELVTVTEVLFFAAGLVAVEVFKEAIRVLCELKLDQARRTLFSETVTNRRELATAVEQLLDSQGFITFIPKSSRDKYMQDFEKLITIRQLKMQLEASQPESPYTDSLPAGGSKGGGDEKPSA
jgi:hypothetical protein